MDDNPQPPAKKVRGGAKLEFLTKMKKRRETGPNTNKISAYCGKLAQNGENFPFDIHELKCQHKDEKLEEAIEELKEKIHEK
ncbi:hypothetical protein MKX03_032870 [Papaver bracteatum]|nr:hypothetical protein MKX03_032870 [Papaver bracteatum]